MMNPLSWTVAIMCYNESETLAEAVRRTHEVISELCQDFEILIVDDGSDDGSTNIAFELEKELDQVRAIYHDVNKGIGQVLYSAYSNAQKEWFSVVPADMEFEPEEFRAGITYVGGDNVVCYYLINSPPFYRLCITFMQRLLNLLLFGMWLKRVNWVKIVPLRHIDVPSLRCRSGTIETEVMYRLFHAGIKPIWLPSTNAVRNERDGGLNINKLLTQVLRALVETIKLWLHVNFARFHSTSDNS